MDHQLIAFDMDGTLLRSDKTLSHGTVAALERAAEAGKIVVFSTGRPLCELRPYLSYLTMMSYGILSSGAVVYDFKNARTISLQCVPKEVPGAVEKICRGRDIMPHLVSDNQVYVREEQVKTIDKYKLSMYRQLYEETAEYVPDPFSLLRDPERQFQKINLFHRSAEEREISRRAAAHLPVQLTLAEETSLEMTARGVSKGFGLQKLCEFLHLPPEQTIAVGDGDNDLDIFRTAGLSIAMGNAGENVRRAADFVVRDNDHDGCAEAVERYLLQVI